MKRVIIACIVVAVVALLAWLILGRLEAEWSGVDETVVERVAADAGREASEPLINTDKGDLLLFVFLLAGAAGGFAAGYFFRDLFPPKKAA